MTHIFVAFLLTSLIGTVLSLFLVVLRPITKKVFSAAWHYYIWLVVLMVMMLPVRFDMTGYIVSDTYTEETLTITENNFKSIQMSEEIILTDEDNMYTQEQILTPTPFKTAEDYIVNNLSVISLIWLFVAIVLFLVKITGYMNFKRKINKFSDLISCPEINLYTKRKIQVRVSEKICTPLVTGVISPVLLLPKRNFTKEQLGNILSHEITHIRRNDILYKWGESLVKCIHWFNPAIYFISRQISVDCEISCDLSVVENMDDREKYDYIDTILSLLSYANSPAPYLTTGMTGKKSILKKRFTMIKTKINVSKKCLIISVVSAVLLLVSILSVSGVLNGILIKDVDLPALVINTDKQDGDRFNMLFAGIDKTARADTLMLFQVDKDSLRCTSIPRNTIYEGKSVSAIINSQNGNQKIVDVIKRNLDVPIHYYTRMNLEAVKEIINIAGGIDFDVPVDMVYEDPYQDLYINLKKGVHTLSGDGVTQLLQYRQGYPKGDMDRIGIHHQVIKEFIIQKLNYENIEKVPEIMDILSKNIQTNYPVSKLVRDLKMISKIKKENFYFEVMPGDNSINDGNFEYTPKEKESSHKKNTVSFFWPSESTTISRKHETRVHPVTGEKKTHNGIDISAKENSPVVSSIEGKVTDAGFDKVLGNYLVIENDNGVKVRYGHLSSVSVAEGDKVKPNSVIGKVGKTGQAVGANLHFEVYINGESRDPEAIFSADDTKKPANDVSMEEYMGFEHKTLKDTNINKMKQTLIRQGNTEVTGNMADLRENYFVGDCTFENTQLIADEEGKVSLFLNVNMDTLFDVHFFEAETKEDVAGYQILANNENAYTFYGFEKGKIYNMQLSPKTKNDWVIEGDYIVY